MPSVVSLFGDDSYVFSDFYIDVIIPFNKDGFEKTARKTDRKQRENVKEEIIELLKNNGRISRKDLCIILNFTKRSIRQHLNNCLDTMALKD